MLNAARHLAADVVKVDLTLMVALFGLLCCWADANSGKPELCLGTFQFVSSSSSGDVRTHIALMHHLDRADVDSV